LERRFSSPIRPAVRPDGAGAQEFAALRTSTDPEKYVAAQLSAYASAKILVEGLKRSGKDLNNERFVTALEKLLRVRYGADAEDHLRPEPPHRGPRARTSFPLTWKTEFSSLSADGSP